MFHVKHFLYLLPKEAFMAKQKKSLSKIAGVGESAALRTLRIEGSHNGATLRTRIVRDKTKYNRKLKHKKSFAEAGDFSFIENFFSMFHVKHLQGRASHFDRGGMPSPSTAAT